MSFDGGRHGHGRRHQMGASSGPLTTFKVPVAGRGAAFTRLQDIGIHGQTHAASCLPPFEARLLEDTIQSLLFRLLLHQAGAGDDHGVHAAGDFLAFGKRGGKAEVFDP